MVKCNDPDCCSSLRSSLATYLPDKCVPYPRKFFRDDTSGLVKVLPVDETNPKAQFATLSQIIQFHALLEHPIDGLPFHKIPFDLYCPSLGVDELCKRYCEKCDEIFPSGAAKQRHHKAMHVQVRRVGRPARRVTTPNDHTSSQNISGTRRSLDAPPNSNNHTNMPNLHLHPPRHHTTMPNSNQTTTTIPNHHLTMSAGHHTMPDHHTMFNHHTSILAHRDPAQLSHHHLPNDTTPNTYHASSHHVSADHMTHMSSGYHNPNDDGDNFISEHYSPTVIVDKRFDPHHGEEYLCQFHSVDNRAPPTLEWTRESEIHSLPSFRTLVQQCSHLQQEAEIAFRSQRTRDCFAQIPDPNLRNWVLSEIYETEDADN
eukprot:TRINITY_DN2241_c0_g1::TRINITY_DN2241_c0_g1_i2::g.6679::m.6679 TRINITY_DN2241_c0_g1::TRINITY_DN2241_c0_g1_i2::g.6679  ORF type:complete len:371 (+),score=-7.92 TRINITY_DN2241_c0_g1_i2:248-1360(+)